MDGQTDGKTDNPLPFPPVEGYNTPEFQMWEFSLQLGHSPQGAGSHRAAQRESLKLNLTWAARCSPLSVSLSSVHQAPLTFSLARFLESSQKILGERQQHHKDFPVWRANDEINLLLFGDRV